MRDGNAARLLRDRGYGGIGGEMRDGSNAIARDQLDEELVGAKVERDDAAGARCVLCFDLARPNGNGPAERCSRNARTEATYDLQCGAYAACPLWAA